MGSFVCGSFVGNGIAPSSCVGCMIRSVMSANIAEVLGGEIVPKR